MIRDQWIETYGRGKWRHHPSANAIRNTLACPEPPEPIRNRPPVERPNPLAFWEEIMGEPAAEREDRPKRKPAPGSPAARKAGCSCPKGGRGKWLMAGCALHGVG